MSNEIDAEMAIARLDPSRDYGERGLEGVRAALRAGEIRAFDSGGPLPFMKDAVTGTVVKGSGRQSAPNATINQKRRQNTEKVLDLSGDDIEDQWVKLKERMAEGNATAMKIYWETVLGRQDFTPMGDGGNLLSVLLSGYTPGQLTEAQEIEYVEGEFVEVDGRNGS